MDHDTVTSFVQDAITELEQCNARDAVAYSAVTVAWIDRLAAINEKSAGLFDEELAELREGLSGA